jgi:hypothetical protein
MVEQQNKHVFIDGDKSNFISKLSINKFKQKVKQSDFQLDDLDNVSSLYLKPGYLFNLISYENDNYKFKIIKKPIEQDEKTKLRNLMRSKIHQLTNNRTNNIYHKAKLSGKVDDEILEEYTKLNKVSKLPVPEPFDVINNPEKYKPIISMILNNEIMATLGKTHSYVKYFNLLANKIGLISDNLPNNNTMYNDIMDALKNKNIETQIKVETPVETPVETINHNITNANSDTEED